MKPGLNRNSRIAALVPHYKCEQWLAGCLRSLVAQTRLPEAIIVVDDGSPMPPVEIVSEFPSVTLLRAPKNAGLFSILQQAIEATGFDGYMFQDADDWSGPRRLEMLLAEAERAGAELIGCQEMRIHTEQMDAEAHLYPVDVNDRIMENPSCYGVLHPSSLVSRSLVQRLGGYASMRFAGDAEFQRRAVHVALVTNITSLCYFRRIRPGALTSAPETGNGSPARESMRRTLIERSTNAVVASKQGLPVDVSPLFVGPRIDFEHLAGPPVLTSDPRTASVNRSAQSRSDNDVSKSGRAPSVGARRGSQGPIFIVGAPRAGLGLLHASLALHPNLLPNTGVVLTDKVPGQDNALSTNSSEIGPVEIEGRLVDSSPAYSFAIEALLERFPDARFVHVVRDVAEVAPMIARPMEGEESVTLSVALEAWKNHVIACVDAERRLGPAVLLQVSHRALTSDSEKILQQVFAFIGEDYDAACLTPLLSHGLPDSTVEPNNTIAEATPPSLGLLSLCAQMIWREILAGQPTPEIAPSLPVLASKFLPEKALAIVLSDGDERYADLGGAVGWHFPHDASGAFSTEKPADSDDAVSQLRLLRSRGAGYLIIPEHAFWWVDYYPGLRSYVEDNSRVVAVYEGAGSIFAFKSESGALEIG